MGISKRQFRLQFQMTQGLVGTLLHEGVLHASTEGVDLDSVPQMLEGIHFIRCLECGSCLALMTTKHLRACSNINRVTYCERHPDAPLLSKLSARLKTKSDEQRVTQSAVLKERFQTEAGQVTRDQISVAARQQMDSGYKEQASAHLRVMNADPAMRKARSLESKRRWDDGTQREKVVGWHQEHKELSQEMAAHARQYISKKVSKPHNSFKEALVAAGVQGFLTEHPVGFYSIDEACPDLKIAVEVDGCYWHGCSACGFPGVGDIVNLDKRKTTYLTRRGWVLIRLLGHEIKTDMEGCVKRVVAAVDAREAA